MVINFITLFFVFYLHIKNKLYKFACIILKLNIMKGEYKQECNRTVCKEQNAKWYNLSTRMYYCESCAAQINYWSKMDSNLTLCSYE